MNWIRAILPPSLALAALTLGPSALGATADAAPAARRGETNLAVTLAPRPPRRLAEDELGKLLTDALNEGRGENGAEWELRLTRPWSPVMVPDEPLRIELLEPALNRITSYSILRFEVRAGRQLVGVWQAPVHVRLWRDVVVAETALQRGQLLSAAPVTHKRRDVLTLRDPVYELPAVAADYEVAESVPLGASLTSRAFRLKPVVFRGKTVDAIMRDQAMTISLKVEVLEEGVPGQLVRVRNLQSRRELRGKVQDEQTVAISY